MIKGLAATVPSMAAPRSAGPRLGWSGTTVPEATAEDYGDVIAHLTEALTIHRHTEADLSTGSGGAGTGKTATPTTPTAMADPPATTRSPARQSGNALSLRSVARAQRGSASVADCGIGNDWTDLQRADSKRAVCIGSSRRSRLRRGGAVSALDAILATLGPLLGVVIGGWLGQRQLSRSWRHERARQLRTERREVYSRFIAAVRTWQSNVLEPDMAVRTGHTGVRYADAGKAYVETIRALAEVRLIAGEEQTIAAAEARDRALRELGESRAVSVPGPTPNVAIRETKAREEKFIRLAREDLAGALKGV
jgi:hypothetical protein